MRPGWLVCVPAFVLLACGSEAREGIHSGSRLRAKFLVDADGDRMFQGFHDRDLDADCAWAGGDEPRCLPEHVGTITFRDAACSDPLLAATPGECSPVPRYVTVGRDDCTDGAARVWHVGAQVAPAQVFLLDTLSHACTPAAPDPSVMYYGAGEEVALDRFVGGSVVEQGQGRLRTRTIAGRDGSRLPRGAFDAALATACTPSLERSLCMPTFLGTIFTTDAGCTFPAVGYPAACEPPRYIGIAHDELELWELSEPLTPVPSQLYIQILVVATGWTCSPVNVRVNPGALLYSSHARRPLADLAPVERVAGEGGGRLQSLWIAGDSYRSWDGFHDRTLDAECTPTEVAAGQWRCLPPMPQVSLYPMFPDPACSLEAPPHAYVAADDVADHRAIAWEPDGPCRSTAHLHELGAELASGSLYYRTASECMQLSWDTSVQRVFMVGAEIPLDDYAVMTPMVE